ncbi:hypothetical protein FOCC_FOCC015021, partial [Frankliniella occidentalis]
MFQPTSQFCCDEPLPGLCCVAYGCGQQTAQSHSSQQEFTAVGEDISIPGHSWCWTRHPDIGVCYQLSFAAYRSIRESSPSTYINPLRSAKFEASSSSTPLTSGIHCGQQRHLNPVLPASNSASLSPRITRK